ncbi:MAG: AAA family ATPase, partial [Propionicimonas sp.]
PPTPAPYDQPGQRYAPPAEPVPSFAPPAQPVPSYPPSPQGLPPAAQPVTGYPPPRPPYGAPGQGYAPPGQPAAGAPVQPFGAAHPDTGQVAPPSPVEAYAAPRPLNPAQTALARVRSEVAKAVVGQSEAVTGLMIGLLCDGHVLLEGVPGVAKTLLVRSLAASLDLETKRVQFTPDLMPGDVTGSLIYDAGGARFDFRPGPVFTNLLLADEINRTPPKTQAALLEAMEERQVTVDGVSHPLPTPFMVIATQNPIEYEGTYPLPEAQLDRFLLKLQLPLPSRDDEVQVVTRHSRGFDPRNLGAAGLDAVTSATDLAGARQQVAQVRIDEPVVGYIVDICRATRSAPSVSLGASPRGATALMKTARAWAWLTGRDFVTPDDVKALAAATLNHRIQIRTEAQMDGTTATSIIANVLATLPVPR